MLGGIDFDVHFNGDGGDVQVGTIAPLNAGISSQPSSPYAYVWVVGGIHEGKMSYKGFIWDVLISASLLRKTGSTADFWIYTHCAVQKGCISSIADEGTRCRPGGATRF